MDLQIELNVVCQAMQEVIVEVSKLTKVRSVEKHLQVKNVQLTDNIWYHTQSYDTAIH